MYTIQIYKKLPVVVSATVNEKMEVAEIEINDEYGDYLWHLDRVNTSAAWDSAQLANHAQEVWVAVIDTGVDMQQPDLVNNILEDHSLYLTGGRAVPLGKLQNGDASNHGTKVAGIIAAEANNSIGVAGVAGINSISNGMGCKIMALRANNVNSQGKDSIVLSDAIRGIHYAVDNGAEIINMSFGTYVYSNELEQAIEYAYNAGVTLVAAAGNDNTNQNIYPGDLEHVISVIASEPENEKAYFSN